jgi:GR25 family glycosyltransferase involved in LPS biosynthesis
MSLFHEIKKNLQKAPSKIIETWTQNKELQEVAPIEPTMNVEFKTPTESRSNGNGKMNLTTTTAVNEQNVQVPIPIQTPTILPKYIQLGDHLEPTHLSNPMEGVSNIYYVNMERSVDRRKHMEALFQDPIFRSIPIEAVPALDGTKESIDDALDFYQCMKNPRMMATEYGCTLSHFRAIHQFAMTDDPVALIVEDDLSTEFMPYWKKSMKQWIDGAPPDWEVIQLSYILFEYLPSDEYERWEMHKNLCGTAAYLITNDAAKRLITYLCRFSSPAMPKYCIGNEHPVYHHADRFLYKFFRTYSTNRPPFTYRDSNDSMIHPDHVDFHAESKEKTKRLYLIGSQ